MVELKEVIKKEDIEYVLNITEEEITKDFIYKTFGEFDGKTRFNPSDIVNIPKGSYGPEGKKNKNDFRTTVGLYTFNKYVFEKELFGIIPYVNTSIDGDLFENINEELSYSILEQRLELAPFKRYLMKGQFLMRFVSILSPNHSMKMLTSSSFIDKERKRLIKENEAELKKGNESVAADIEKQLLQMAEEYLKDDPSMDMYKSKARGKFNNAYKNMFIMKGAIPNPDPSKGFDITTSNYIDGISKQEYATFANSAPTGAYYRAKNTQVGGYWVKLYNSAFQHIVLDKTGSDCGTKRTIDTIITPETKGLWMYSYIVEGSKLVELTSKNISSYYNKPVKVRFSALCESEDHICNICMGNLYYRLGVYNAGMTTTKIPSRVMNLSLKKFHDSTVKIISMDVAKAFNYQP